MSDDKLHDECGVVGVFLNNAKTDSAATLAYYGLYSLQHRGQESAGIAVSNDEVIKIQKAMGLVSDVFVPRRFS